MTDEVKIPNYGAPEISEEKVYEMLYYGFSVEKIARYFDTTHVTIYNKFKDAVANARLDREMVLRKAQFKTAVETHNPTMLIWLGKNELFQTDQPLASGDEAISEVTFTVKRVPRPSQDTDE